MPARRVTAVTRQLLDADVLDPVLGLAPALAAVRLAGTLQVGVDQRPHHHQGIALQALPLVAQLGRGGGAEDLGAAADRAPVEALVLAAPLAARFGLGILLMAPVAGVAGSAGGAVLLPEAAGAR